MKSMYMVEYDYEYISEEGMAGMYRHGGRRLDHPPRAHETAAETLSRNLEWRWRAHPPEIQDDMVIVYGTTGAAPPKRGGALLLRILSNIRIYEV